MTELTKAPVSDLNTTPQHETESFGEASREVVLLAPSHTEYVCEEHLWRNYSKDDIVPNHLVPGQFFTQYCEWCGADK